MSRKLLVRSDVFPYHVTARVNRRDPFPVALSEAWTLITHECLAMQIKDDVRIHAFVLMPNHLHLLLTVPTFDLGIVMNRFMRNITMDINRASKLSGRVFGGPYHWSLVDNASYYRHVLKYVLRNPVKAGLRERVEDYPYSTYPGMIGEIALPFPIHFTRCNMESVFPEPDVLNWIDWLNVPFRKEVNESIRLGLKRKYFRPPVDLRTRMAVELRDDYDRFVR